MSTTVFPTIEVHFKTCLKAVIIDKKMTFPIFSEAPNGVSTKHFSGAFVPGHLHCSLLFRPNTDPEYHGL